MSDVKAQQETAHMKTVKISHQPVTLKRLERALAIAAYRGAALSRARADLRSPGAGDRHYALQPWCVGQAKRLLESYGGAGGVKGAIA
jgi:hypothetical protein